MRHLTMFDEVHDMLLGSIWQAGCDQTNASSNVLEQGFHMQ